MLALALATFALTPLALAVDPGQPAPDFTLIDLDGKSVALSSLTGKTVVLEWFNPGCPFVVAAHSEGPLVDLAAKQPDGVVWLAINSGAPGKQGAEAEVNRKAVADWKMSYPVLLDPDGKVGKAYGAATTPQLVVIDPKGVVAYNGALDNAPLNDTKGGKRVDWAANAIANVLAGKPVEPASTKPWGCSVKY